LFANVSWVEVCLTASNALAYFITTVKCFIRNILADAYKHIQPVSNVIKLFPILIYNFDIKS
jgi:hypothetical protein